MPRIDDLVGSGKKNPKIEKKTSASVVKKSVKDTNCNSRIICNRKHGFQSLGTHCLRYISPKVKGIVESQNKEPSEQIIYHVAAFDLDDTLIKTKTGMKFSRSADDWKWWNENVPDMISTWFKEPLPQGTPGNVSKIMAVFTNQGSVVNTAKPTTPSKSLDSLIEKLNQIINSPVLAGIPLVVYAATRKGAADKKAGMGSSPDMHDDFRKPQTGMWKQLQDDLAPGTISTSDSFFVGDAAGRKKDFSDSDVKFARALGMRHIVPEDFFRVDL